MEWTPAELEAITRGPSRQYPNHSQADTLTGIERAIAGPAVVQLRLPLRDSSEVNAQLERLAGYVTRCRAILQSKDLKETEKLAAVRQLLRQFNSRANDYKRIRND